MQVVAPTPQHNTSSANNIDDDSMDVEEEEIEDVESSESSDDSFGKFSSDSSQEGGSLQFGKKIAKALKDEGGILRVQAQLSLCWWRLGDRAKALPLRRRCLEQLSRKDYPIDMIVCLFYFAMQLCDEEQSLAVSLATFILDKHTIELLYERELRKLLAQCVDIRPPSSAPETLQGWLLELQLLPST